ncbi:hypothetical protein [Pseudomonas sp.]|uniref:hypothetical protein n=1 Tax=Pseudomonas sp. TaxID=306 RepID=UPI00258A6560|nr:hypothetical protein [Pseudomonas sp.]
MNNKTINNRKDIIDFYERFTHIPKNPNKNYSKNQVNPIIGKMFFGQMSEAEIVLSKQLMDLTDDWKKLFIELFMFSDLKLFSPIFSVIEFDVAVGRGDFDFLNDLVPGLDTRNAFEVEEFASAIWFNGVPSPDFIKPFYNIRSNILKLQEKYSKQEVLKNRLYSVK